MRGALLGPKDYEPLLKLEGAAPIIERLKAGPYGPKIDAASARFENPVEIFAAALRANLSEAFEELWKIAPAGAEKLLKAALSGWEVYDIKSLVRGIARNVRRDEIADTLIPAGELDTAALKALLSSRDIPDLIRFLDTWGSPYAKPLKKGLNAYQRNGGLMEMEINIDIYINGFILSQIGKGPDEDLIRDAIVLRIDLQNILTLFKIVGEGYSKEGAGGFFIGNGKRINRREFMDLSAVDGREELLGNLTASLSDLDLKAVLSSLDTKEMALLEEKFDDLIQRRLSRLSIIDPLSIALGAAFIYMKIREIKNLRLIERGRSFGMPEDELRRLLIYPV